MAVSACMGNRHTDASSNEQLAPALFLVAGLSAESPIARMLAEAALPLPSIFLLLGVGERRCSRSSALEAFCCFAGFGMSGG